MSAKITDLTTIVGAGVASTDVLVIVDVSDATMAASGTDKKVSVDDLRIGMGALNQTDANGLYSVLAHTHAASALTGTTLAAGIVTSSLTAVGTITSGVWTGTAIAIANGGTGQITAALAINALLPSQTSNNGKYLTTDGSVVSWGTVSASDATKLPLAGGTVTGTITSTMGTVTVSTPVLTATETWNAGAVSFQGIFLNVTNTASATTSRMVEIQLAGTQVFAVGPAHTYATLFTSDQSIEMYTTAANAISRSVFSRAVFISTGQLTVAADSSIGFSSYNAGSGDANSKDVTFKRSSSGVIEVNINGQTGQYRDFIARTLSTAPSSSNGQFLNIKNLTELTTIAAAATTDTTIQMPAGAIILSASVRVTTAIPTATTFDVGDSGLATRFSTASVAVAINTTNVGTKAGAYYNAGALSVRFTMNGGTPAANTGRVRVTIYYIDSTPPTS